MRPDLLMVGEGEGMLRVELQLVVFEQGEAVNETL